MRDRTEIELSSMERRLNAIRMYDSERLVAIAAMRKGFIIVERIAWLAHNITQIGACSPNPTLRPEHILVGRKKVTFQYRAAAGIRAKAELRGRKRNGCRAVT